MPKRRTMEDARALFAGRANQCWYLPPGAGGPHGNGYDRLTVSGQKWFAHRLAYTLFVGPISEGHEVDHQCHNRDANCPGGVCPHRKCVNPAHLEAVPPAENKRRGKSGPADNARKTHCPEGHEYATSARGRRYCPPCRLRGRVEKGETSGNGHWRGRTHCPQGHPYDEANTYIERKPDGTPKARMCRACQRERARQRRARKGNE
jgi:hypothetical protein